MIEPKKHLRPITRTPPQHEDRIGKVYRFDRNEKTTPFPEEHLKKILNSIHPDEMSAYPQLQPFYQKLSDWLGVKREQLLLSSGSDTAIRAIYEVYVDEGDEVVTLTPTYGMYVVYGRMFGAITLEVNYNEDFSLPVDRILDKITQKTKLVVLANPNHTGTVIPEKDIINVIEKARQCEALVLIDEAYFHFYDGTMLRYIDRYDNLIIIRTFSKAFGIAPLRVGYIVSNKEIISQLYKVKLTHEITMFGAKTASYLLDHLEIMTGYVKEVTAAKEVLYKRLPELGFEVVKSQANFVFFKAPSHVDGKQLLKELEKKQIFLKGPFGQIPFTGHLRVTVGTPSQMNMLCDEIKSLISTKVSMT